MQYKELRKLVASLTLSDFNNRTSEFYIKLKGTAADHTNCILKESNIFPPHTCFIVCTGFATKSLRNLFRVTFGRRSAVTVETKIWQHTKTICINGVLKLTSNAPELNDVRRKTKNRNITFTDRDCTENCSLVRGCAEQFQIYWKLLLGICEIESAAMMQVITTEVTNTILTNCYSSSCQLRITSK